MNELRFHLPSGDLNARQTDNALYGRELLKWIATRWGEPSAVGFAATPLSDDGVVVTEMMRGGTQIFVADDRSVLVAPSHVSTARASAAFSSGERTDLSELNSDE